MRAEAQVLKGHLGRLLLASLEHGPRHGYAGKQALPTGSDARFDLPTGTISPPLRRLQAAGLVKGTWAEAGGGAPHPPRPPPRPPPTAPRDPPGPPASP